MIAPVPAQSTLFPQCRQARAVVFLTRPGRTGLSVEGLADLFGLTPAEARLTIAIAEGKSLNAFAESHHISSHTARTQIKRVFEKTGTHSQADLVSRVLTSPLVVAKLHLLKQ